MDRQKNQLIVVPKIEELQKLLDAFPQNKTPGLDGLTIKVYNNCWLFIGADLFDFVASFWNFGTIPQNVKDGVIKHFPKKPDKQKLFDWQPLTMVNILYNLLAQILANRLKKILSQLVSKQQTWFVLDRNILENILIAWMTKDWINYNQILMLFL